MITRRQSTTDAVEILHRRYFDGKPEMVSALEEERTNAAIAQAVYDLRTQAGLTQRQLAARVGTSASVICRLEDADYEGHSLSMLRRIAATLGKQVELRFIPELDSSVATTAIHIHKGDESQVLEIANQQYTKALLMVLKVLGVPQKVISDQLKVSQKIVSKWAKGESRIQGNQEQALYTMIIEAASRAKTQHWHDYSSAARWYKRLEASLVELDGAMLETEKAYANWIRDKVRPFLKTTPIPLEGYAMTPNTHRRLKSLYGEITALNADLAHQWKEAMERNRRIKALIDNKPTAAQAIPDYIPTALNVLLSMVAHIEVPLETATPPGNAKESKQR